MEHYVVFVNSYACYVIFMPVVCKTTIYDYCFVVLSLLCGVNHHFFWIVFPGDCRVVALFFFRRFPTTDHEDSRRSSFGSAFILTCVLHAATVAILTQFRSRDQFHFLSGTVGLYWLIKQSNRSTPHLCYKVENKNDVSC